MSREVHSSVWFPRVAALLIALALGAESTAQEAARPAAVKEIQLSFKRDPRMIDPYRGIGPWVTGSNYGGATAQDTVEARAEGVDAAGKPTKINPQWISSDPEMVTVSPSQGDDVKIAVHRAGESKLKITYQGVSKELVVRARYEGKFMLFEIGEALAAKPNVSATTEAPPARKSKNDMSYAVGMNLAKALQEQSEEVDVDSLMQGVKDKLSEGKTRMTEEQALAALEGLQIDQRIVEEGLNRTAVGEKNKREGEAFLAENKKKEGVVTLPSGLQYKIIKTGEGEKPTANDVVNVQYRGTFIDGKEIDKTYKNNVPLSFPVNAVIKGWTEALQLMPAGSKWQLFVPSDLAYGERGAGGGRLSRKGARKPQTVGPNATLIFEMELLAVNEPNSLAPVSNWTAANNGVSSESLAALKKALKAAEAAQTKSK